jgi:hypothetical protein
LTAPPNWRNPDFAPDFTHIQKIPPQDMGRPQ